MVNLESQNLMHLSDFSVLHEIFLPNSSSSIDPKLVLPRTYLPNISQVSPQRKDPPPPLDSSPAPVPLSVHELERVESKEELGLEDDCGEGVVSARVNNEGSPLGVAKTPPVDIVNLAAEEIRKPLLKVKDDAKVYILHLLRLLPNEYLLKISTFHFLFRIRIKSIYLQHHN